MLCEVWVNFKCKYKKMAKLGRLIIDGEYQVTGRMVLTVDLVANKLATEPITKIPISWP